MERSDEKKSEDGLISRKSVAASDSTSGQRGMTTTDSGDKRPDIECAVDASTQKPEGSPEKEDENFPGGGTSTPPEAHKGKSLPREELPQNYTTPSKPSACAAIDPGRIETGGIPVQTAKVQVENSEGNDRSTVDKPPMKPLVTSADDDKNVKVTSPETELNSNVAGLCNAEPPALEASTALFGKREAKSSPQSSSTRNPVSNVGSGNPLEDPSNHLRSSVKESSQSAAAKITIPSQDLITNHGSKAESVSTTDVKTSAAKLLPLPTHEQHTSTSSAKILNTGGSDLPVKSQQTFADASSSQIDSAPRFVEQATVPNSSPALAHQLSEGLRKQVSSTSVSANSSKAVTASIPDPDSREHKLETSIYATQQQSSAMTVATETRQINAGEFHSTEDAAIAAARSPLTNLYAPYICNSADSSLEDARNRLKKAISQTRYLRHAFTERIYGKYRVCLKPPPEADEIISQIRADPVGRQRKLKEKMAMIREEKEIEKKEAAKLNIELAQSATPERASVLATVENAEQLMYISAGLNLVVLPEDKQADAQLLRGYDESPVNPFTGKRITKNISQAAAAAGEVILDRTRKAAAMRFERQRRRQLQLLRGDATSDGDAEANYSRLQVLSTATAPPTGSVQAKVVTSAISIPKESSSSSYRRTPVTAGKTGRSRAPGSLSASVLLNLNAIADEMKIEDVPSAATAALIDRGVGLSTAKTTQQRLRHPHPESAGGRRRASANGPAKKDNANPPEPFLQAYLALTLPPLPATKERIERKPLPVQNQACDDVEGLPDAVRTVLRNFISDQAGKIVRPIPKISLLNSFRKNETDARARRNHRLPGGRQSEIEFTKQTSADSSHDVKEAKVHTSKPLDSVFVFSVLHSLGILCDSNSAYNCSPFTLPDLNDDNHGMASNKLKMLRKELVSDQATFVERMMQTECVKPESIGLKAEVDDECLVCEPPANSIRVSSSVGEQKSVPLEHIRGGGEVIARADDGENRGKGESETTGKTSTSAEATTTGTAPLLEAQSKKRKRADSSPGLPSAAIPRGERAASISHIPLPGSQRVASDTVNSFAPGPSEVFNPLNSYFANSFHHFHHPATGELVEYLGSLQHHQHIPNLMSTTTHTLGYAPGITGLSVPDTTAGNAAARVMLARDQHTAALLGGFPQSAVFPTVGPHPTAMTGFLGPQNAQMVAGNPATKSAKGGNKPTALLNPGEVSKKPRVEHQEDHHKNHKDVVEMTFLSNDVKKETKTLASHLPPTEEPLKHQKNDPLSPLQESLVKSGHFHKAAEQLLPSQFSSAIDCLLSSSATVPIPKGLVLGPLKERLNTPGFKSAGSNSTPPINRDIVSAVILVWLWDEHKTIFKEAFEKNGRIDVDPNCKWFIMASIDAAVRDLSLAIADSIARGEGAFSEASLAQKSNSVAETGNVTLQENNRGVISTKNLDVCTASIVSKALAAEVVIDAKINSVIPGYQQLLLYLDESRQGALRSKSQERTLLATLIGRKCMMSESFAYAYVSSVVRAGDALGHGELFETVQDEATMSSTMVPHDIFTDDDGYWEDPCKPENGFSAGLKGDELLRRAHARALIHKALRKLQDRHGIRGGTSTYGPLIDPGEESATVHSVGSGARSPVSSASPRPGKRKVSLLTEPYVYPGTGSAAARSWAVYDPKHFCPPIEWYPEDLCNQPYGLHSRGERFRSLPLSSGKNTDEKLTKKLKRSTSFAVASRPDSPESEMLRSTREIAWGDVASIFRRVEVPKKSRAQAQVKEHSIRLGETIFAPFCRPIDIIFSDDDESDTEEDLQEETVLARHQVVLDEMKAKLNAFLEARKKEKEERKIRYSK